MKVAILGTGKMGAAMASRLAGEGVPLVLWNRTRERVPAGLGAVAATPFEAAGATDIVLSSLTGPEAVRDVYLGPHGAAAVPGKLFVEMSTVGPWSALELEPAVRAAGSSIVDAPVVGSVGAAAGGTLEILAGGRPENVRAAEAVLSRLGHLRHVGPLGSGARLKLVSNAMLGGSLALAAELQRLGTAVGLDPESVLWALSARFPYLAQQRTAILEHRHDQVAFAMRDLTKDLDLAAGLERDAALSLPLTDHARRLFDEAPPELGGQNVTAIMETDV